MKCRKMKCKTQNNVCTFIHDRVRKIIYYELSNIVWNKVVDKIYYQVQDQILRNIYAEIYPEFESEFE